MCGSNRGGVPTPMAEMRRGRRAQSVLDRAFAYRMLASIGQRQPARLTPMQRPGGERQGEMQGQPGPMAAVRPGLAKGSGPCLHIRPRREA